MNRVRGLSSAEAAKRLREHGPNRLVAEGGAARVREIARLLADPMALMLAGAAALYVLLGNVRDGVILLVALVPVLGVDALLEVRSRRALRKLAAAVAPMARVIRDDRAVDVPSWTLVPGDLLVLQEGDVLHADGVIREAANLTIDESHLTGESVPQEKRALLDATASAPSESSFFAGSRVLGGQGFGTITVTGNGTQFGQIASLVAEASAVEPTPLQRRVTRAVRVLIAAAVVVALFVMLLEVMRGVGILPAFLGGISLAMAAAPEEFPLVFTLFLSLGAWRLSRRHVLVRRLVSVETLGSTTVICTDKTGTMTTGELALAVTVALDGATERAVIEAALLACEIDPTDALERSIADAARRRGVTLDAAASGERLAFDYAFEPAGKHMSHVWIGERRGRVAAKGALEGILEHCSISEAERRSALEAHDRMARQGMRVLAVAGREAPPESFTGAREADERSLMLLGLLGFRDPLRPEVPAAIADCRASGIRVKLLTGDYGLTASSIAASAGLPMPDGALVTGAQLAELTPEAFSRTARDATVFARVRPEQKYQIVETLVRDGETVAMIGDGVNDAPALKRASIGVSLGQRGTEVARAAADMVLLDDNLASLVAVVREGRHIYLNIQRAFLFLLAFHVPIIGLALSVPLIGLPLMLLPVHLVWLELVVHPIAALVFEGEPAPRDLMHRPPRAASEPLVSRGDATRAIVSGLILTAGALGLYWARLAHGVPYARSAGMAVIIFGSLAILWAERALGEPWWRVPFPRTARFWTVCALVVGTLLVLVEVPAAARTFGLERIDAVDWLIAAALALASVAWRAPGVSSGRVAAGTAPQRA